MIGHERLRCVNLKQSSFIVAKLLFCLLLMWSYVATVHTATFDWLAQVVVSRFGVEGQKQFHY